MIRVREFAKRAALPTAALWVLESRAGDVVRARIGKLSRRRQRAELYFAFDDPYSLLGVDALRELEAKTELEVSLFPVVRRGVGGGPDVHLRRQYAVLDAGRLARRAQRAFLRSEPIAPQRVEELAAWVEVARDTGVHRELITTLLERLWAQSRELPDFGELYAIFKRATGKPPPTGRLRHRMQVRKNEANLKRRGHWDTPAIWIEGKLFFAHERGEQMLDYVQEMEL